MNPSLIKQQQNNLLLLATQYSQHDLDNVMAQNPMLTRNGLESQKSENYASNRAILKKSLKAFQLCCAYLSLCRRARRPCPDSLHSGILKNRVEYFTGTYIPSGAIVAAAECLGIKYKSDPMSTPYVWPHISSRLPFTMEMEMAARRL